MVGCSGERFTGGGVRDSWHQKVSWIVGAGVLGCCFLFILPFLQCAKDDLVYAHRGSNGAFSNRHARAHTHISNTQSFIHARVQTLYSRQYERIWILKALALSGNGWLWRYDGSWLLLVLFFLLLWFAEKSVENRCTYLLYIAYVASCSPKKWMRS